MKEKLEFELKRGPQGHVYLPKRIWKAFGDKLKFLPNTYAAVIYPENTDPNVVISSLQVIISDLRLRASQGEPTP